MISGIIATVVFVRDLTRCTAFYRDTFKLPYTGSDANSSTFLLQERYLILLSVSGAADLLGSDPSEFRIDGAPRVVLAAGVEDVDAAYEELSTKGSHLSDPQPISLGGCARRTLPTLKATLGRSTSPLKRRQRDKRSRSGHTLWLSRQRDFDLRAK